MPDVIFFFWIIPVSANHWILFCFNSMSGEVILFQFKILQIAKCLLSHGENNI